MLVMVHPITLKPIPFAFPGHLTPILEGPYKNCEEMSKEWLDAEVAKMKDSHAGKLLHG